MPSEFDTMMGECFADSLEVTGESVTFRGVEYTATVSELAENPDFMPGAQMPKKSCNVQFLIPETPLSPVPDRDERITTPYGEMKIVSMINDGTTYLLTVADIGGKR